MPKNVTLERNGEIIYPRTKVENIIDFPEIVESESAIWVGTTPPDKNTRLWLDTTDNQLEGLSGSQVIQSIQDAIYLLQQKVNKLMLLRTQGVISGKITDGTLTELGNSAEPQIPDIIAEDEEEFADVEFPEYAVESEPTVNHVTIKMGTWREINSSKRFFINGELVWCTDQSTMYIYVNGVFKKVASSSTSPDQPIIDPDDTMDTTELQQYLDNLDHINFVPVNDPDNKYTVKVNEYGNLIVYNADNDSVLPTPSSRGLYFPGKTENIGALIINSFYLGGSDKDEHSYQPCSHNYVEIANISYQDINLNGLCLMYTSNDSVWYKLPLWGIIKAQSTFLIRGAQCSVMDVNTTKLKVKTFDMEWYVNDSLIKFDRGSQKAAFYLCWCDLEDSNKIYVMDGTSDVKADYPSTVTNIFNKDTGDVACGYVDLAGVGSTTFREKNQYELPNGQSIDENTLFARVYTLDPVTQSNAKGTGSRNNKKYWRHVNLDGLLVDNVEAYTPKASFEHKNLSFDKHNFDPNKPNTLTCTFGIQATDNTASGGSGATRGFCWNSVGYYDEYLWFKKLTDSNWTCVESYKKGVDYSTEYRPTDPLSVRSLYQYYTRIRWETYYGAPMTTHKVLIGGLTAGTYEYKVGRMDEYGDPTDYVSKTRQFTVKADADVASFDFIQVTDQQGANWEEYQVWDLSADFINRNERIGQVPKVASTASTPNANSKDFDFVVNTGDICYNGSRPNEWIDYYNGYSYIDDKEEMFTIGNNDLAPVPENFADLNDPDKVLGMQLLGWGDERPNKVNHVVADLFYTQEMDPANPPIFIGASINGGAPTPYKVPSLYSFNYGEFHYISLNSEIRTGYPSDTRATTVDAEFGVVDNINGYDAEVYDNVEDWMVKDLLIWKQGSVPVSYNRFTPQNCQKAIIYTHEMPFTITAAAAYNDYLNKNGTNYRETSKAQLNMKHSFQFQRLFKLWGIRLVFGGHKHTCSVSMPIYDAPTNYVPYQYENNRASDCDALMQSLSGADTFNPIIQVVRTDSDAKWGLDAKVGTALEGFTQYRGKIFNSSNSSATVNLQGGGSQTFASKTTNDAENPKPLCRYEIVDSISAPTYVMCQATGFKNLSNSDASDGEIRCQWQRGLVQGSKIVVKDGAYTSDKVTPSDQLYPFYTRFKVTSTSIIVEMHRVADMYTPSSSAGYWNPNRDMPNGHEAKMDELYRLPWITCEISLL